LVKNKERISIGVMIFIAMISIFWSSILSFIIPVVFIALPVYFLIKKSWKNNFSDFLNEQNKSRNKVWNNSSFWENFFKSDKDNFFDIKNNFNKNNNFKMNNLNLKSIAAVPVVLWLLWFAIITDWIVNVPAWSVAVIFDRWSWVLEEPLWEWIHLKIPFWQKSTVLTTRVQAYTMSSISWEWDQYWDDAIAALTKDGQKVSVDITVQFNLEKVSAPEVYQTIWLDYVNKIVRPWIRSIARENITRFDSKELFSNETRQKVQSSIEEQMNTYLEDKNVKLVWVLVRNIEFSKTYLDAIEEKQVAQQKIQKAEYEKEQALIVKETKIIQAEAEAESIKLKWQALKANNEIIQLQMVDKLSPNIKWWVLPDSVMPLLDIKNMQ